MNNASLKARWQTMQSQVVDRYQSQQISASEAVLELTGEMDTFLVELVDQCLKSLPELSAENLASDLAILAVGGYGRREMFPHSDVDLLLTYDGKEADHVAQFTSIFVRECWDAGLKLGHAVRSISQTVSLCRDESQVATSIVETRLIWGNPNIETRLRERFSGWLKKSRRLFIDHVVESRLQEVDETASAVFSLEPDVKASPGGLRDLQLIRWVGYARYGHADYNDLVADNALQPEVADKLQLAYEYLTEIRMDLHVHAPRVQDLLSRQEQLRLTDQTGVTDYAGQRAVERFMQRYFRNADLVAHASQRFVELNRPSTLQERVAARVYRKVVQESFVIVGGRLNVLHQQAAAVTEDLEQILKIFLVAIEHDVQMSSRLLETIKLRVSQLPNKITEQAAHLFFEILTHIGKLGPIVRNLFECGILELLIPQFSHARGLLQFNLYHAYTVDEHTFRTLEALDRLRGEDSLAGRMIDDLKAPELLSFALILHDVGKGFEEDHSVLGAKIAAEVGPRLGLPEPKVAQVVLLIREHLSMSVLAFRRDTSDPEVVASFSKTLQDADSLRKLYLLTICDIQSVAPGIWNDWKAQLLEELCERCLLWYSGMYDRPQVDQQLDTIRHEAIRLLEQTRIDDSAVAEKMQTATAELNRMPEHYLLSGSPEGIAAEMNVAVEMPDGQVQIIERFDDETNTWELTVLAKQCGPSRCFHRLVGVLTALNCSILSADIHTSQTGLISDRFSITDRNPKLPIDAERLRSIQERLREAVLRPVPYEKLFQKHRRYQVESKSEPISGQKSRVAIDNHTASHATIIEVFAHDRAGLLFTISKAIFDLNLSIIQARITTHVDQVVDVIYVTDLDGNKVDDEDATTQIRDRMTHSLSEFERVGYRMFID